jgi:hypothetical protein
MGDFNVKAIPNNEQRATFYRAILKDLRAFQFMLDENIIEDRSDMIGAEQEMCIVDSLGNPAPEALNILGRIDDHRFTNELALYNLEVNLSPQKLTGDCFTKVRNELEYCLGVGRNSAAQSNSELFLIGMLPTINFRHLMFEYMTPEERYKLLSEELLKLRGRQFEVILEGVDDFQATLDSVLFEACNTSFQLHLQVAPDEFVKMHNWAQMISGPVLSACANSPLLFGKELWSENRIALFKQSVDTRGEKNHSREIVPRVYFGKKWLSESAIQLWRENVVRFPLLLQGYGDDDPIESLKKGVMPKLKSIGLHNGTTYTWNRLCYGIANNVPHIRIECRYVPSGPTSQDEVANFAFWIGLMKGIPKEYEEFWKDVDFKVAKSNFLKAARTGVQTVLYWFGGNYQAKELIIDVLIPMAREGLRKMSVDESDIELYLGTIHDRVSSERTGAQWQKSNFRTLRKRYKPSVASRLLVQHSLAMQKENIPIYEWKDILCPPSYQLPDNLFPDFEMVEDIMNNDVISLRDNASLSIARKIMEWREFHHIPVEDANGRLVGIMTASKILDADISDDKLVSDVMTTDVICAHPDMKIGDAQDLMMANKIGSLPVVENEILVGILTKRDFPNYRDI